MFTNTASWVSQRPRSVECVASALVSTRKRGSPLYIQNFHTLVEVYLLIWSSRLFYRYGPDEMSLHQTCGCQVLYRPGEVTASCGLGCNRVFRKLGESKDFGELV